MFVILGELWRHSFLPFFGSGGRAIAQDCNCVTISPVVRNNYLGGDSTEQASQNRSNTREREASGSREAHTGIVHGNVRII